MAVTVTTDDCRTQNAKIHNTTKSKRLTVDLMVTADVR